MVDLHTHVLPGFDDGPESWNGAVQMCRRAAADGIGRLVATPRFYHEQFATPGIDQVETALAHLRKLCKQSLVNGLEILMGSECRFHDQILANLKNGRVPTINGSRYFLLKLPEDTLPSNIEELVYEMCIAGKTPIITSPERNRFLAEHPRMLFELIETGAYGQVGAGSLTGEFGGSVRQVAIGFVKCRLVQMLGSGAHDPETNPPVLSDAVRVVEDVAGTSVADMMVDDVPVAVIEDRPIKFADPILPDNVPGASLWKRIRRRFRR